MLDPPGRNSGDPFALNAAQPRSLNQISASTFLVAQTGDTDFRAQLFQ